MECHYVTNLMSKQSKSVGNNLVRQTATVGVDSIYAGLSASTVGTDVDGGGIVPPSTTGPIEGVPESHDLQLIKSNVDKRKDLWKSELDAATARCVSVELELSRLGTGPSSIPGDGVPTGDGNIVKSTHERIMDVRKTLETARSHLWSVLWAMHVARISDSSNQLRDLRRKELMDAGREDVSEELECLDKALDAVGFVPIENSLCVVAEKYPDDSGVTLGRVAERMMDRVRNWELAHGSPLFDPESPRVIEFPGMDNDAIKAAHKAHASGCLQKLKLQKNSGSIVTVKPGIFSSPRPKINSVKFESFPCYPQRGSSVRYALKQSRLKVARVSPCGKCGMSVRSDDDGVVNQDMQVESRNGRGELETVTGSVLFHSGCLPGSMLTNQISPYVVRSTILKFPCDKCGKLVVETDGEVVGHTTVKLESQIDSVVNQLVDIKTSNTKYFHYACSPDFIGYCLVCQKPLLKETQIVRPANIPPDQTDIFLFHKECLPVFPIPSGTLVKALFDDLHWYKGVIKSFSSVSGRYSVLFPGGDQVETTLPDPNFRVLSESIDLHSVEISDGGPAARAVVHQDGSAISRNKTLDEFLAGDLRREETP
jgi:hypothetical protein